jgi:hypothetical protein
MRLSILLGNLLTMGCAALALGGCAVDRIYTGGFWVEPGKYDFLKCPDLAKQSVTLSTREREIVSLMERANQDPAGGFINLTVYRSDLEQVRAQLDLVNQTARQKSCDNLVGPSRK